MNPTTLIRPIFSGLASLILITAGCLPATAQRRTKAQPEPADSAALAAQHRDYETAQALDIFFNIFREVTLSYVDTTDPNRLMSHAAEEMLRRLDPYTEYLPEDKMAEFQTATTGKYAGLGSLIRQKGEWVEIIEPYKDSPADKAGLRPGDRILAIDGASIRGKEVSEVSELLRGESGTRLELTYRPIVDTTTRQTVVITRERITLPAVPYSGWIEEGIGYIRFDNFTENSATEVRRALTALQATGRLEGLILDLRANGGGIVSEGVKTAALFLPRGTTVVELRGRTTDMNATYRTTTDPVAPQLPLVVLIGSSSASTSEIVAGALQDLDRAVIIGQRSFGKGLVQTTRQVGAKEFIKITTAKYYTPSGRCIQAMDYSHRNEDGSVGHVPDSLVNPFPTQAGRTVYDGGGIMPDIRIEPEYFSKFTAILITLGYLDDFANRYAVTHDPLPLQADGTVPFFEIDDETYADFCRFMDDKPIDFESATERRLAELRRMAEREKYAERIGAELDAIAEKIKEDKEADLQDFAPEIRRELANMIAARWYYGGGQIEHSLRYDTEARQAAALLKDPAEYNRILTQQDTERK